MYVCVCKGVSDRTVLATIRAGARTVNDVGKRCGAGTDCGACRGSIREMLEDHAECPYSSPAPLSVRVA